MSLLSSGSRDRSAESCACRPSRAWSSARRPHARAWHGCFGLGTPQTVEIATLSLERCSGRKSCRSRTMLKTSLRFTYLDAVLEKKRVIPFRPPLPLSCAYVRLRTRWISGVCSNILLRVNRGDHGAFPSLRSRFQAGMSAASAARRGQTRPERFARLL